MSYDECLHNIIGKYFQAKTMPATLYILCKSLAADFLYGSMKPGEAKTNRIILEFAISGEEKKSLK